MSQPLVYLSGPVTGLSQKEASCWREVATAYLLPRGYTPVLPARGIRPPNPGASWPEAVPDHPLGHDLAITQACLFDVRRSTLVFVNLLGATQVSRGTLFEIAWAYALQKPVVLAIEPSGNPNDCPMVRTACAFRETVFADALDLVVTVLGYR